MKPFSNRLQFLNLQSRGSELGLLLKVLLLSTLLACGIHYLGPLVPLPATNAVALMMVLLLPLILGLLLLRRWESKDSFKG